jgi:hypothetical protein
VKIGVQTLEAARDFREEWPVLWAVRETLPTGIEAKEAQIRIE